MNRTTIDFGIDLGTTNSAVAVLKGVSTEIIKNNADTDITPSAVSIDKKGIVLVGQRAKNRSFDYPDDSYLEFKRRMGTDHVYQFKASGQSRLPEELSAEVLKSLRADVQQRVGEDIQACVVTVPAAFELHQCDATRKAARLAGFKSSPLLQEPVAAALAYGFQTDQEKAYWLVYDFGGGTFDAAIIKAEEGTIHVVNHGGDNFLGGSDIDWAIVEKIMVPRLLAEFNLPDFNRGNKQWRQAFARLKYSAEIAKIDLSRKERTTTEPCKLLDASGEEIEFECEVKLSEVVTIAEPFIQRSIEICQRVLKEKNLSSSAIERVILVGGPTLAPYFREVLSGGVGIKLDHSVDPLTVVARGAAVFAGTQRLQVSAPVAAAGEFAIDLKHKPVGMDSEPMSGGKVTSASVQDFTGFTIEVVNTKTQWRSGKISLRSDGVFIVNLHAEQGERNNYSIELFDPEGRRQKTNPDSLSYTIGAVVEEQPLINSMGIALANNECDHLCEKGRGLPLKAGREYRTIHGIRKGETADVFNIPVVEGEFARADRNRLVGMLTIKGEHIQRDLPAGSEVEVALRIDESRLITVTAYVPLLDEEFAVKLDMKRHDPNPDVLRAEYEAEMRRFGEAREKAGRAQDPGIRALVAEVERLPVLLEVKNGLIAAKGDPDAAAKCDKQLLELKLKLDEVADALEWPALVAEARRWLADLDTVASALADREKVAILKEEVEEIIAEGKLDRLQRKLEAVRRAYYQIVMAQPAYWVNQFQHWEKQGHQMKDQQRAMRLIEQGRECVAKNNANGLQNVVRQMWDLLPKEAVEAGQRGYQSGLTR